MCNSRIGYDWTQEKALTFEVRHRDKNQTKRYIKNSKLITDYLSNQFKSV